MAIFKDFIDQVEFPAVWELLSAEARDMENYRDACQGIFTELKEAVPKENTAGMTIKFVVEEPEWSFYFADQEPEEETEEEETAGVQVYGFVPGDPEGYAIGLKPAEVLVGLNVDAETASGYTPTEIVAYCMAEMIYTATMASSAYGTEKDMAGGGLLASQVCMDEDIQNVDLSALRRELGAMPKQDEDYKTKYGFLF